MLPMSPRMVVGHGGVTVGMEFGELAAGDPDESVEVGGAGVGDGFPVGAVVHRVGVDLDGDDAAVTKGGVVGVGHEPAPTVRSSSHRQDHEQPGRLPAPRGATYASRCCAGSSSGTIQRFACSMRSR